jgi:hypothetical protein
MTRSTSCRLADCTPSPFTPIVRRAFTPPVANSGTRWKDGKDCRDIQGTVEGNEYLIQHWLATGVRLIPPSLRYLIALEWGRRVAS